MKATSWFYNVNLATGFIFIADNSKQLTYRVQAKFGYKFSNRLLVNVYGTQSTIASTTAAEFTFNEIGLRLKWNLFDKLIFDLKKQIAKPI